MFNSPRVISHIEQPVHYTIFDSLWIPCSAKFLTVGNNSNDNGVIQIYEVCGTELKLLKEGEKSKPLKCGTFGASSLRNRELAVGDLDGKLNIWNIEDIQKCTYHVNAHDSGIMCIDGIGGKSAGFGAPEIVTGGKDGYVKVWDPRLDTKPVIVMEPMNNVRRECWTVTFGNSYNSEERVVCAGYENGDIKLFDLKTMSLRWETHVPNGVCSLEFDRKESKMNRLLVTCLDSTFHVFSAVTNGTDFSCLTEKKGNGTIWLGRHLPQKTNIFATCGDGGSLYLWKYGSKYDGGEGSPLELLTYNLISAQPTSSFNWCPDKIGLALHTSFDETIRLLIVTKLNNQ